MTTALHTNLTTHLIHPEWLANNLDARDVRILDARPLDFYTDSHIPNAHSVNMNDFRHEENGIEGLIIPPDTFADYAGRLGIDKHTLVVIYDDYHGLLASRLAWSFLYYGHATVGLLDGGWDTWEAGAYPTTVTPTPPATPRQFASYLQPLYYANFDDVQRQHNNPQTALLDVRSSEEYDKGHIPSAVQWDWQNGASDTHLFGNLDAIRAELAHLGITPDKEIITYCQSGVRASHTFFLLRHLGFQHVRMYDGSWAEWSVKQGA